MGWLPRTDSDAPRPLLRSAVFESALIVAHGIVGLIVADGEPIDRTYLNVYVPTLQTGGGGRAGRGDGRRAVWSLLLGSTLDL